MERQNAAKLLAVKHDIRCEIIFDHIAIPLLKCELINREEYQRIMSKVTDPDKIDELFNILPQKNNSFEKFVSILSEDYPWLIQRIIDAKPETNLVNDSREQGNNYSETDGICSSNSIHKLNQVVTREMINIVKRSYLASKRWTDLAHSLGMTRNIHNIRSKAYVYDEDLNMCLVNLLQEWVAKESKNATLNNLIRALREEELTEVADDLEEKFT